MFGACLATAIVAAAAGIVKITAAFFNTSTSINSGTRSGRPSA
jgi:hypothetical protein